VKKGKVYLAGAGPGDPGLITVKAIECVKRADVIVYDRLISRDILKSRKKNAVLEYVGKAKGHTFSQDKINELLLNYARRGMAVLRLKGGDPFVFGRGPEEMLFLMEHGIGCEVIPGVSSSYAAAEACGIPVTHRGMASGFLVITGHEDPAKMTENLDYRKFAKFQGTIVVMMGLSNLKDITARLIASGKNANTPAAVISSGTTKKQKIVVARLSDIAEKAKRSAAPAVCVIGGVVKLGFSLNPKLKPLLNKRFISTASDNLNRDISKSLRSLGASVKSMPMIKIVPAKDTALMDKIISNVRGYDWLVFTSRHGVHYFVKRYLALKARPGLLKGRIACVGSGTAAEFEKYGIKPDLMPEEFTTRELALTLVKNGIKGKQIALLRTNMEKDYLKGILVRAGAQVTDCLVYTSEPAENAASLVKAVSKRTDGIFFLSPKSVKVFFDLVPGAVKKDLKSRTTFFSIGPVTTIALKKQGVKTVKDTGEHTVKGLVELCLEDNR